jgi:hypothetical protein
MSSRHVGLEHYLWTRRGEMSGRQLLRLMERHLLDRCPECRAEWEALSEEEKAYVDELLGRDADDLRDSELLVGPADVSEEIAPDPSRYASAFDGAARQVSAAARQLRFERKRAGKDLARLMALPADERLAAIRRSRKRYRTAAMAQLLVEEARTRVRRSPDESLAVLDLVRPTLEAIPGALGREWARALEAVAHGLRANALRVAGDLPAADQAFRVLRRRLAAAPLDEPAPVEAELASLEASLRRDQRRYDEAAVLLDRAAVLYEAEGEAEGLARVLIQRAEVSQHFDRHPAALADLQRARELLDPERQPFLHLLATVSTVPTLLDLGRGREAERVLCAAEGLQVADEPWWRLRFRFLAGRAAVALREHERAEKLLEEARRGFLEQGLVYDAAAAALELAVVALHQGDTRRVREMTREIAPVFERCGVVRDALAALALFEQAKRADAAALALAAALRRHLAEAQARRRPGTGPRSS